MVEVGDNVYNYTYPKECSVGTVVSRESEIEFTVDFINSISGELYKRTILDYDIYKK